MSSYIFDENESIAYFVCTGMQHVPPPGAPGFPHQGMQGPPPGQPPRGPPPPSAMGGKYYSQGVPLLVTQVEHNKKEQRSI